MLRQILVESTIKHENTRDRTERAVLDGQQNGPVDEVSSAGRMGIGGYSWDSVSVIADQMLSIAAEHQGEYRRHDRLLASSATLGNDSDNEVTVAHELALSPHDLGEDVTNEVDEGVILDLNIDNDSSGKFTD